MMGFLACRGFHTLLLFLLVFVSWVEGQPPPRPSPPACAGNRTHVFKQVSDEVIELNTVYRVPANESLVHYYVLNLPSVAYEMLAFRLAVAATPAEGGLTNPCSISMYINSCGRATNFTYQWSLGATSGKYVAGDAIFLFSGSTPPLNNLAKVYYIAVYGLDAAFSFEVQAPSVAIVPQQVSLTVTEPTTDEYTSGYNVEVSWYQPAPDGVDYRSEVRFLEIPSNVSQSDGFMEMFDSNSAEQNGILAPGTPQTTDNTRYTLPMALKPNHQYVINVIVIYETLHVVQVALVPTLLTNVLEPYVPHPSPVPLPWITIGVPVAFVTVIVACIVTVKCMEKRCPENRKCFVRFMTCRSCCSNTTAEYQPLTSVAPPMAEFKKEPGCYTFYPRGADEALAAPLSSSAPRRDIESSNDTPDIVGVLSPRDRTPSPARDFCESTQGLPSPPGSALPTLSPAEHWSHSLRERAALAPSPTLVRDAGDDT